MNMIKHWVNAALVCAVFSPTVRILAAVDGPAAKTNETPRLISADLQQTNGPLDTMFNFCVGAGRANEGLRADWQRQLTYAHRECGFQYIRMHGLFTRRHGRLSGGQPRQPGIQLAIH